MKQIFSFLFFFIVSISLHAQQVERAKEFLQNNRLREAKAVIDAALKSTVDQSNADAWYTKARIYNAIASDAGIFTQFPTARMEAFNALKKYTEIDPAIASLKADGYKTINDIYVGFYREAANKFNNKEYAGALSGFADAILVSSFMSMKGWVNTNLDTASVLYAGVSAEKMNRQDEAAKYYRQLVNAKVRGEGYVEIYKWLAHRSYEQKNFAEARKYLNTGNEVYPGDPFWKSLEIDIMRAEGNKEDLFQQYDKTIAADPGNHLYRYNYAIELYQHAYKADTAKRPINSEVLIQKALNQLNTALNAKPDYAKAQLFTGQIIYNQGVDLLSQSKKLAVGGELREKAMTKFGDALPYFLTVERQLSSMPEITAADKKDLIEVYDLIATIYAQQGLQEKKEEYEKKLKELEN